MTNLARLDPFASPEKPALPALSTAEIEAISAQTQETLETLLTTDALGESTVRAYASALRYWDAWHRAAFGQCLPLLAEERRPVSTEVVCAFLAHHTPVSRGDQLVLEMPEPVRQRLFELNAVGNRLANTRQNLVPRLQKGARTGRSDSIDTSPALPSIRDDVPTIATIRHRLSALAACHRIAQLPVEWQDSPVFRGLRRALGNRVSKKAPAMLRKPKAYLTRAMIRMMIQNCVNDGIRGLRDAALIQVAFFSGGRRRGELIQMHWPDLATYYPEEPVENVPTGYVWTLREMKGKQRDRADKGVMDILILGKAVTALDRWRDVVLASGKSSTGPVWWRVVNARIPGSRNRDPDRFEISTPMIGQDVWAMIRMRCAQIGLDPADFGAHSLRSGAVNTYLLEGGALNDASSMVGHSSTDVTSMYYDHRGVPEAAIRGLVTGKK